MIRHRFAFIVIGNFLIVWSADRHADGQPPILAPDPERLLALESNPDDHPVFILKLLKYEGDAGRQSYQRYFDVSVSRVRELDGEVIFYGDAKPFEVDFGGTPGVFGFRSCPWDSIVLERFRSRKDLRRLGESEAYRDAMTHRRGSVKGTVVYALNGSPHPWKTGRSKAETAGPPDPPMHKDAVYMLNLLKFKPGGMEAYFQDYGKAVMPLIIEHGGRVIFGLEAEQLLVGDEEYDRVILVEYPSVEAFTKMILSEDYREISHHRTDAIEIGHLYGFSNNAAELKKLCDQE